MDDYVRIPDSASMDVTEEVTVEVWARIEDVPLSGSGDAVIIDKMTSDPIGPFGILICHVSQDVRGRLTGSDGEMPQLVFTSTPDVGILHHYTLTWKSGDQKAD